MHWKELVKQRCGGQHGLTVFLLWERISPECPGFAIFLQTEGIGLVVQSLILKAKTFIIHTPLLEYGEWATNKGSPSDLFCN